MQTDPTSEDQWRSDTFSEEQIVSAKYVDATLGGKQPTLKQLIAAAEEYGPEGILDSALHLSRAEYEKLAQSIKTCNAPKPVRRRKRR